jgi:hypothetical protein
VLFSESSTSGIHSFKSGPILTWEPLRPVMVNKILGADLNVLIDLNGKFLICGCMCEKEWSAS